MKFTDDLTWLLQSKREASVEIHILQSRLFGRDINLESLTFTVDYNCEMRILFKAVELVILAK